MQAARTCQDVIIDINQLQGQGQIMTSSFGDQTDTPGSNIILWTFIAISVVLLVGLIAYAARSKGKKSRWLGRFTFKSRSLEGLHESSDNRCCVPWYVYPLTLLGVGVPVLLYYKDTIRAYFNPDSEEADDTEDLSTYVTPKNIAIGGGVIGLGVVGIAALRSSNKPKAVNGQEGPPIDRLRPDIEWSLKEDQSKRLDTRQKSIHPQSTRDKPAGTKTSWFDGARTPLTLLWWLADRLGRLLFTQSCVKETTGEESKGCCGKLGPTVEYRIPGFIGVAVCAWIFKCCLGRWWWAFSAILAILQMCLSCKHSKSFTAVGRGFGEGLCSCARGFDQRFIKN